MKSALVATMTMVMFGAACTGTRTENASPSPTPGSLSPSPQEAPTMPPTSDIRFVLDGSYLVGDKVHVGIENVGDATYWYQFTYEACYLSYFDSEGRKFIIPPGTHCDILGLAEIKPGQTKGDLFAWDLDECLKDNWGCSKSRPLPPGTYTIRGRFKPVDGGTPAIAEESFQILPSY